MRVRWREAPPREQRQGSWGAAPGNFLEFKGAGGSFLEIDFLVVSNRGE